MTLHNLEEALQQHTDSSKVPWLRRAVSYALTHYWEVPANILEAVALVLVVFVQDIWFPQCVALTAALLTASFVLHGLAYKAGQCQVWPKIIEVAAPLLFYGLILPAFLATDVTHDLAFVVINFWFVAVQLGSILLGRNFIREYYHDLNPKAVWGTPLIEHCALVVGFNWVICQTVMGLAQVFVIRFGISIDKDVIPAVMMCYVMQLLPLIWALAFTFIYPWHVKRRWGYVWGVRESCYPSKNRQAAADEARLENCDDQAASDVEAAARKDLAAASKMSVSSSSNSSWVVKAGTPHTGSS